MSLMDKFADPSLFETLSASEKATGALITTGMGMGITFFVLILLWGAIVLMSKAVNGGQQNKKSDKPVAAAAETVANVQEPDDEEELIAVIAAAIEAYEAETGGWQSSVVVRSIKRTSGNPWAAAGINDCAVSRKQK